MSLEQAQARLAELEGPRQRFHAARHAHETMQDELARAKEKHADRPAVIAALQQSADEAHKALTEASAAYAAHRSEHGEGLSRHIDAAAQAVIDARDGAKPETVTEGN